MTRFKTKSNGLGVQVEDTQICVVMVGLPARGKSLIAQKGMYNKCQSIQAFANLMYHSLLYSSTLSQMAIDRCSSLQCR